MCDFIDPACLMANLFLTHENYDRLPMFKIREAGEMLEFELNKENFNVMIIWTRPTVMSTFESYADMFKRDGSDVLKVKSNNQTLFSANYIENEFNSELPSRLKIKFKKALTEIVI